MKKMTASEEQQIENECNFEQDVWETLADAGIRTTWGFVSFLVWKQLIDWLSNQTTFPDLLQECSSSLLRDS